MTVPMTAITGAQRAAIFPCTATTLWMPHIGWVFHDRTCRTCRNGGASSPWRFDRRRSRLADADFRPDFRPVESDYAKCWLQRDPLSILKREVARWPLSHCFCTRPCGVRAVSETLRMPAFRDKCTADELSSPLRTDRQTLRTAPPPGSQTETRPTPSRSASEPVGSQSSSAVPAAKVVIQSLAVDSASVAQHIPLRYDGCVPISTAAKVASLAHYLGSQRRLAAALGVDPAQISRWQQGQLSDLRNAERVDVLELVLSELSRLYEPDVARRWLEGLNPHLGDRRPIDVVRSGRAEDLLQALRAEFAGSPA
jgi:uncharacterized protein (DUF2384 family)